MGHYLALISNFPKPSLAHVHSHFRASCTITQILRQPFGAMLLLLGTFGLARRLICADPVEHTEMKRARWIAVIINAAIVSACNVECEYESQIVTARVSLTPPSSDEIYNCADNPVEVNLTWNGGSDQFRTTDYYNPPRSCVESLGLVDGAEVKVLVEETTGGGFGWNGLVVCGASTTTFLDIDPTACDAVCNAPPVCPASEPVAGTSCSMGLGCHYGNDNICSPDQGPSLDYTCIDGVWTRIYIDVCDVCGISCEPPCDSCADTLSNYSYPVSPDQLTFCTPNSQMLYGALYACSCLPGNPCEPVCNAAPSGEPTFCNGGGMITTECQICVMQTPQPNGCQTEFEACINDL